MQTSSTKLTFMQLPTARPAVESAVRADTAEPSEKRGRKFDDALKQHPNEPAQDATQPEQLDHREPGHTTTRPEHSAKHTQNKDEHAEREPAQEPIADATVLSPLTPVAPVIQPLIVTAAMPAMTEAQALEAPVAVAPLPVAAKPVTGWMAALALQGNIDPSTMADPTQAVVASTAPVAGVAVQVPEAFSPAMAAVPVVLPETVVPTTPVAVPLEALATEASQVAVPTQPQPAQLPVQSQSAPSKDAAAALVADAMPQPQVAASANAAAKTVIPAAYNRLLGEYRSNIPQFRAVASAAKVAAPLVAPGAQAQTFAAPVNAQAAKPVLAGNTVTIPAQAQPVVVQSEGESAAPAVVGRWASHVQGKAHPQGAQAPTQPVGQVSDESQTTQATQLPTAAVTKEMHQTATLLTPSVQAAASPAPSTPVAKQVADALQTAVVAKPGDQIVVRLDPPDLGTVRLTLATRGGELRGVLEVDNHRAMAQLQKEADILVTRLADSGVQIKSMDVVMSHSAGDQSSQGATHQFAGRDGSWQNAYGDAGANQGRRQGGDASGSLGSANAGTEGELVAAGVADGSLNVWI